MAHHYIKAGQVLDDLLKVRDNKNEQPSSMKSLLFGNTSQGHLPTIQALITNTLKYKHVLEYAIHSAAIYTKNKFLQQKGYLIYVMVYDLIFGKGIGGAGNIKKILMGYKNALKSSIERLKVKWRVSNIELIFPEFIRNEMILPRYARINRILVKNPQEIIQLFQKDGYELTDPSTVQSTSSTSKTFAVDPDIGSGNLLVFPGGHDLHSHPTVLNGQLILQDKASCISGYVLEAPPHSTSIDSMAAPGMKTSQLAESMQNSGTLYAIDKSSKRLGTLEKLTQQRGIKNIVAVCSSFLEIDPESSPYSEASHILCDPSCSGSGIVNRQDDLIAWAKCKVPVEDPSYLYQKPPQDKERLEQLSSFQLEVLLHAFKFPKVSRVVYSTCSIHKEENEDVVEKALKANPKFKLKEILPEWPGRGQSDFPNASHCVRCSPDQGTIGFFVACFEPSNQPPQTPQPTPQNTTNLPQNTTNHPQNTPQNTTNPNKTTKKRKKKQSSSQRKKKSKQAQ